MVLISDAIVCNKDFSERNVKNLVAETEKLNSLIYIETLKKRQEQLGGESLQIQRWFISGRSRLLEI